MICLAKKTPFLFIFNSSSRSWHLQISERDLKMRDDGFQHHVGGHDVQLIVVSLQCAIVTSTHAIIRFSFFPRLAGAQKSPMGINCKMTFIIKCARKKNPGRIFFVCAVKYTNDMLAATSKEYHSLQSWIRTWHMQNNMCQNTAKYSKYPGDSTF